jgi:hypothetical protein
MPAALSSAPESGGAEILLADLLPAQGRTALVSVSYLPYKVRLAPVAEAEVLLAVLLEQGTPTGATT